MSTEPLRVAAPTPAAAAPVGDEAVAAPDARATPEGGAGLDARLRTEGDAGGPSDEFLMARVAATGDDDAFDVIYRRYRRSLAAYLWRCAGGDGRTAEEMVQETLERVWRGRAGFDPNRRFRPWLYTIATNVARDRARRHGANRELHGDVDVWLGSVPAPASDSPEAAVRARRLMVAAERAILALPDLERSAFLLVRRAGLDYREGAAAAGCSLPAFKMRVSRALEHLADALQPWLEGGTR